MENLLMTPSINLDDRRLLGGQQRFRNSRLVGAIKSAFRLDDAKEIAATERWGWGCLPAA